MKNWKKISMKLSLSMMLAMGMTLAVNSTAFAQTVSETESNNSKETAQSITANNEKAQETVTGKRTGQYVVNGYTSSVDEDWFKVYLSEGTKYMTCNDNTFEYHIEDVNGNDILNGTYTKSGLFGPTAYEFDVATAGYYYVRITGVSSSQSSYIFLVGSPTYSVSSCDISCREGSINMTKGGGTKTGHFDGNSVSGLPQDAITYSISMSGVRTTSVDSIRLANNTSGLSFALPKYTWQQDDLVSMKMPVNSTWTASFGYYKVTSFTPVLKVYYVYPVYTTMVQ